MFLSFQTGLSFVIAGVVCAILESISRLDPSPETTDPRYLKLLTVSSFSPQTLMSVLIPSAELVGHQLKVCFLGTDAIGRCYVKPFH